MTATRQFLVTIPFWIDDAPPSACATVLRDDLKRLYNGPEGRDADITVVPLPNLAADDTHLQVAFRGLSAALASWSEMYFGPQDPDDPDSSAPVDFSKNEIAALVAELSKQPPARTSRVDQAALDALWEIRESDKRPGQQVQKNARAQLIITDAICRCVPEETV